MSKIIKGLSVIIPSYNAAPWLEKTIPKIDKAIKKASDFKIPSEIIVVDDGSKDDTVERIRKIEKQISTPLRFVKQNNEGRYSARKNGLKVSKYNYIWFIDTRVFTDSNALKYVYSEIFKSKKNMVWNAHVYIDKDNMIARFMEAVTFIGWRKYFKNPRRCSYDIDEFDYYPKGTTSFIAPKSIINDSLKNFEKEKRDLRFVSDDTHLIRYIAGYYPINLSPKFSCIYHSRSTLKSFIKHTYHRGQVFVDGFLRTDTRFFIPLIFFLAASIVIPIAILLLPHLVYPFTAILVMIWVIELISALVLGVNYKDAFSLFVLTPVFAIFYGLGVWKAVIKKIILKSK